MKKSLTELVFILDKSGSMSGLESDTIGGYNAMLKKQQEEPGEAIVTTVLFDDEYELLHDRISIKGIQPITEQEYFVVGTTALLDAIGITIHKIDNAQQHTSPEHRADKVLFVITTDGMENASREYNYDKIKHLIEQQKHTHGWEFIFLGANIDAIATAANRRDCLVRRRLLASACVNASRRRSNLPNHFTQKGFSVFGGRLRN